MKTTFLFYSRLDDRLACRRYRTAVSLHSHTFHSRESLSFITAAMARAPWFGTAVRWQQARYGVDMDLSRAWWTPPLSPTDAWRVEYNQISRLLSMEPIVSLTDHDNIDAASTLTVIDRCRPHPISFEWTVPFRETFFHLGVHNLPPVRSREIFSGMQRFTEAPSEPVFADLLAYLNQHPEVLIVFNHPCWDEKGIGGARAAGLLQEFLALYGSFVHALELNGLRPWNENQRVIDLAHSVGLPLISGGDRHGREPNANVNLTNAGSFSEFVEEVRCDRWSLPLFLPQYEETYWWRLFQVICDVLRTDEEHGLGWTRWSDRVFYSREDGTVRSLTALFGDRPPLLVRHFVMLAQLAGHRRMREALRLAVARKQEVLS